MVCYFCNDSFHLSQNCRIYASDFDRKQIIYSKKHCLYCLSPFKKCSCFSSSKKFIKTKCYSCFSYGHNDVFCPERFLATKFFQPKIDNDLLQRFYQMLSLIEQFNLTFSTTQETFNFVKPKMFNVVFAPEIDCVDLEEYRDHIVSGTHTINLYAFDVFSEKFDSNILKNVIFKPKDVTLSNMTISKSDLFQFLSDGTESFECSNLTISPSVTFVEILDKLPCMKKLSLEKMQFDIPSTWPEDMIRYLGNKKLNQLSLMLKNMDFDVILLAKLMKKKFEMNAKIYLTFDVPFNDEETYQMIAKKFSRHFIPSNSFLHPSHEISPEIFINISVLASEKYEYYTSRRINSFKLYPEIL